MTAAADLTAHWRTDATTLRRRGAEPQATTLETCAEELEAALREHELEALTLQEAAGESGYSAEHLRRRVRDGTIPAQRNGGTRSHIRISRKDLPKKPGKRPSSDGNRSEGYNVDEDARDIAQRIGRN